MSTTAPRSFTLHGATIPSQAEFGITIGEYNYQLVTRNDDGPADAYIKANGIVYEPVTVPRSMPGSGHHSITSPPPAPWLPTRIWNNFQLYLTTRLCKARGARATPSIAQQRRANSDVRAIAWHPHQSQWAVALHDDTIALYNIRTQSDFVATGQFDTLTLTHQYMTGINTMMWNPVGGTQLAVACEYGVALWSFLIPPAGGSQTSVRTSQSRTAWMTWLRRDGHQPVSDLAYSPCGRWLATCSSSSHNVLIWNVAEAMIGQGATPIGGFGGTVSLLRWSPCGNRLLAACSGGNFRVWDTRTWTSTLWETKEAIHNAAWSADSNILLLSSANSSVITSLNFDKTSAALNTRVTLDVSPITDDLGESAGGIVNQMVWSPTSQRLAISFLPGTPGCDMVALFATQPGLVLSFNIIGFIRGPASAEAMRAAAASTKSNGDDSLLFSPNTSTSSTRRRMDTSSSMHTPAVVRVPSAVGVAGHDGGPGRSPFVPFASPIAQYDTRTSVTSPLSTSTAAALAKARASAKPNMPVDMHFQPNCTYGALLSICWSEGQVTSIPMYFALSRTSLTHLNLPGRGSTSSTAASSAAQAASVIHDRASFAF